MEHGLVLGFGNRRVAESFLERVHFRLHRDQLGEGARGLFKNRMT